jgi:hypothetical protein
MEGIGIAQAKPLTAKDRLEGRKICRLRSFDFRQDGWITQESSRFPDVFFIPDMLSR